MQYLFAVLAKLSNWMVPSPGAFQKEKAKQKLKPRAPSLSLQLPVCVYRYERIFMKKRSLVGAIFIEILRRLGIMIKPLQIRCNFYV